VNPPDPACPGRGRHGVWSGRGSCRAAGAGRRRRSEATSSRWFRRCSSRLALVTATSASTGAIIPAAASSVRCSMAGRRAGTGAGGQVTVTDSHHPALRMAPAASSRRQCPRDRCTCCCQCPWLSRSGERPEASCMDILCARLLSLVTMTWSGGDRRMARCVVASRTGWVAIACRVGVTGSGRVTAPAGRWRRKPGSSGSRRSSR